MDYAAATAAHRPLLRGQRQPAALNPLRHLTHLQGLSLLIDLKAIRTHTKDERADFVIKDLGVPAGDVLCIFEDHITQLIVLSLETQEVFDTALGLLREGVPWSAAEGALVTGSSASEAVSAVRVSNIPPGLPTPVVLNHMKKFGTILSHNMGRDRHFPRASDGVLHITMVLNEVDDLPHFIQVVDENDRLSNSLPVHMDSPRRRCYRCGRPSHMGTRCNATVRAPDAPPSVWSNLVVSTPPPPPVTQPLRLEATGGASIPVSQPLPPTSTASITTTTVETTIIATTTTSPSVRAKSAVGEAALGGQKRSLPSSGAPSSSSERDRSKSPMFSHSDTEFTVVNRGRNKKRNRGSTAAADNNQQQADLDSIFKTPLATRVPAPSSLEDAVLKPNMEEEISGNGGGSD